jgi:DNA-directed RNA polymerase specialized sigma24 family protein
MPRKKNLQNESLEKASSDTGKEKPLVSANLTAKEVEEIQEFFLLTPRWDLIYKMVDAGLPPRRRQNRKGTVKLDYSVHEELVLELCYECLRTGKTVAGYLSNPANITALIQKRVTDYFRAQKSSTYRESRRERYVEQKRKAALAKGEPFDESQVKRYKQKRDVKSIYYERNNVGVVWTHKFGETKPHPQLVTIDTQLSDEERDEYLQLLLDLIDNPKHREIFFLFLDNCTWDQIAEATGVKPETARKTVQRVQQFLAEAVQGGGVGDPKLVYAMLIDLMESGKRISRE